MKSIFNVFAFLVIFILIGYAIGYIYGEEISWHTDLTIGRAITVLLVTMISSFLFGLYQLTKYRRTYILCDFILNLSAIISMSLIGFRLAVS
ncbi:hypothetical protein [Morganella morganii]|uniref:hypothetical protein n=1 Tax=Morganella morganii TaxID=582 RepID=UPI0011441622|nr:hypothetical protein [Morganella morganii]EJF7775840.1 hypothetical protein [Salmonella enterica subsp. enterica]EKU6425065.1 hypothetical protein [Morganella morganii]ELB3891454.1 hypothetical protein [Morganella morganii]MBT0436535.1 hypothetical protein [Morganella morganii subsp. morganii]MBT0474060.1 hypothetical protein [Morganella morganii subsp. morganii]